ncbi:MAG: hypothetical protein ACLSXM_10900 [Turicibacter sanguinis]|uniref:Uncharacterized protein n=1 Tax=Turicibacter sanguinis TaxID=154288 RepID=A0A9X4XCP9_9FIRM|nr:MULTISPECIES: hypothetical protein [Turicibacter]EGC92436.1 hypothetical protein HMPREF9402_2519 [Turicibacter sp. HGF1]MBP3904316.1 hypothetical protein [Turicibacter sp.]MCU7190049.1 hypothetical protein [Turicibacter sanguinis]MCU7195893.1 hypothetical protein [Turicibacter sanguinis]MCU7202791.1 hypothetical protein [Turicibacter sanguinis]
MKEQKVHTSSSQQKIIQSSIHHTYQLKLGETEQQNKTYFARLRGYRDRK